MNTKIPVFLLVLSVLLFSACESKISNQPDEPCQLVDQRQNSDKVMLDLYGSGEIIERIKNPEYVTLEVIVGQDGIFNPIPLSKDDSRSVSDIFTNPKTYAPENGSAGGHSGLDFTYRITFRRPDRPVVLIINNNIVAVESELLPKHRCAYFDSLKISEISKYYLTETKGGIGG